ncbi:hypothetical protein LguiA_026345 [Lonicera macranthoides]
MVELDSEKPGVELLQPTYTRGAAVKVVGQVPQVQVKPAKWTGVSPKWSQGRLNKKIDETIQNDLELQSWCTEILEVGHGDRKAELWWPKMQTKKELIDSCTIIIWVANALHAEVNFGQYPYAGYLPNRPTLSLRYMPEPGSPEYAELEADPEKAYLKTITPKLQTLLDIALIEILSRHASDKVYLGKKDTPEWTKDTSVIDEFRRFGERLGDIEKEIVEMNK